MSEPAPGGLAPLRPRERRFRDLIGARELLLGALAVGMMVGVSWVDDRYTCERLDEREAEASMRDTNLAAFAQARCEQLGCTSMEVISTKGCLGKVRYTADRVDDYGEALGTFVTVEGLAYSPMLERWRVHEILDDKQLLGLPVP